MFKILGFVIIKIGYIVAVVTILLLQLEESTYFYTTLPLIEHVTFRRPTVGEFQIAAYGTGILMLIGAVLITFAPKPHL